MLSNTWDLDLKAAHDEQYGPASSGDVVTITIKSGVLVSASTTSLYALTNPSTWAAGVVVRLVIESGAIVAGRGGDGGDGGIVFGSTVAPTAGSDGGNSILAAFAMTIDNGGIISGGSGGGGGSGGASCISFSQSVYCDGSGGGGGWPYGVAGASTLVAIGGTVISGGLTNATNATSTANGTGGNGAVINESYGEDGIDFVQADVGDGGDGGSSYAQSGVAGANAANSSNDGGVGAAQSGAAAGSAGDAIHGNSYITWVATGTRYGAIV